MNFPPLSVKTLKNIKQNNGRHILQMILSKRFDADQLPIALTTTIGKKMHITSKQTYPQVQPLPLPPNIDAAETNRFSPQRTRDITANVIQSHPFTIGMITNKIDITVDNSMKMITNQQATTSIGNSNNSSYISSYDCTGAISLSSAMQSNVPIPFGGMHKFSHLNMPGGQWEQGNKFTSNDLQSSHYINLRKETRMNWSTIDGSDSTNNDNNNNNNNNNEHIGNGKKDGNNVCIGLISNKSITNYNNNNNNNTLLNNKSYKNINTKSSSPLITSLICIRYLHANNSNINLQKINENNQINNNNNKNSDVKENKQINDNSEISRRDKLKKAIKEYGSTVIVFHVGISLLSLGMFYGLVSSGLDVIAILQYFGWENSTLSNKLATGASTFVIAYAVHKVFAPVRISITLGATPFIVRYLRLKGFLKPTTTMSTKKK